MKDITIITTQAKLFKRGSIVNGLTAHCYLLCFILNELDKPFTNASNCRHTTFLKACIRLVCLHWICLLYWKITVYLLNKRIKLY
jgi:hypothetical protein